MTNAAIEQAGEDDPEQAVGTDRCTAPAEALPTKRTGGLVTLGDCFRGFLRQPSPPYLFGAVALVLALRILQGVWSWRDAVMAAGLLAVTPFVEWAIHVYLLHAPPFTVLGRRVEMLTAREHRTHHESPGVLDGVLLPVYGVLVFLPLIALIDWALSFPISLVLGGPRLAYASTGVLVSFAILAAYESEPLPHPRSLQAAWTLLPRHLAQPSPASLQERALLVWGDLDRR
jgi:hypothetical protein